MKEKSREQKLLILIEDILEYHGHGGVNFNPMAGTSDPCPADPDQFGGTRKGDVCKCQQAEFRKRLEEIG